MLETVLDASGAAALSLLDEAHHAATRACIKALAQQGARFIAPPLFESEFDSILRRRIFLNTLTPQAAAAALHVVDGLQIEIVYESATRVLARNIGERLNQMRVYDATYAALAQLRGCDFWTADQRFSNAARGIFPLVRFLGSAPL